MINRIVIFHTMIDSLQLGSLAYISAGLAMHAMTHWSGYNSHTHYGPITFELGFLIFRLARRPTGPLLYS
jgi:hypothetical protein